jgi:hypothetical protein
VTAREPSPLGGRYGPARFVLQGLGRDRTPRLRRPAPRTSSSTPADDPVLASAVTLGAPDNTIASGVSESQIAVGWRDNSSSETTFEVYRSRMGPDGGEKGCRLFRLVQ